MGQHGTILVVDDSKVVRRLLTDSFAAAGYAVLTAEHGQKALEILRDRDVDLLTLDAEMPVMDGFETCRRLRGNERTCLLPVIMLTALATAAEIQRGFEAGVSEYVAKPVSAADLIQLVNSYLRSEGERTGGRAAAVVRLPASRLIVSFALKRNGLEPRFFDAPGGLLEASEHFDLVVIDAEEPLAEIYPTLHALRAKDPEAPLVVLGSDTSPDAFVGAYLNGAADYLVKPFETRVLSAKVQALYRERRYRSLVESNRVKQGRMDLYRQLHVALSHYLNNISTSLLLNVEYLEARLSREELAGRLKAMRQDIGRIQSVLARLERISDEEDVPLESYLNDIKMVRL